MLKGSEALTLLAPLAESGIRDPSLGREEETFNSVVSYPHPQSLQIAAFLFTVCHVVIVVQDWFTDLSLYR